MSLPAISFMSFAATDAVKKSVVSRVGLYSTRSAPTNFPTRSQQTAHRNGEGGWNKQEAMTLSTGIG